MKKIVFPTLFFVFFLPVGVLASPQKSNNFSDLKPNEIKSQSAVVIDNESNAVLFGKNENKQKPAASLTKIVGAYVFLERNPNLSKNTTLQRSDEVGGGRLRLPYGTRLKVKDMLYASLIGSANNSANSLVRLSGLSKNDFLNRMNQLARDAGCSSKTNFVDACGISPQNVSSAKDLAIIGKKVFANDLISQISSRKRYSFPINNGKGLKSIFHTSSLAGWQNGNYSISAVKTGYLPEVGNNLLVKAEKRRGKGEIIAVVMGAPTKAASNKDIQKLVAWAFENYKWQ